MGGMVGALSVALFAASVALADPPSQPPTAGAQAHNEGRMQQHSEERMQRLAGLVHDALTLRPDQEANWRTFLASMEPSGGMMMQRGDEAQGHSMTTPQMLDQMAARMNREQAEFSRHAAAVRHFYAVLSPTQQRTFDALMVLMHHGMNTHGMRGMDMHDEESMD